MRQRAHCSPGEDAVNMQRFAVELKRRTVGIAVRLAGGFVFYSSDKAFEELDGRTFARARQIERQLEKIAKRQEQERRRLEPSPLFA
jgi:hypothetical protein